MTLEEYIRDPAPEPSLSASVAHVLLTRSAAHAWLAHPRLNPAWAPEATEQTEIGTLAHALLLEQDDDSRVVVVEADDWRTKAAKLARDEARAEGKLPVLAHKLAAVRAMVAVAHEAIAASELAETFATGRAEQTFLWLDGAAWCRCRPDLISADRRVLVDYKTTGGSAEPDSWARGMMLQMGYDVQAAFGLRAARVLHGVEADFVFVVQETEPPYAVSFVGLAPAFQEFAEQKRRHALTLWRHCREREAWPGYPSRTCWAEPPGWALTQWDERRLMLTSGDGTVEEL